ncbi:hypothetical protein HY988_06865 [Candidatus Micrarchaeota archaeon]|nr:hypothetical protein [Candidatus Micrarchaeota archaeon]
MIISAQALADILVLKSKSDDLEFKRSLNLVPSLNQNQNPNQNAEQSSNQNVESIEAKPSSSAPPITPASVQPSGPQVEIIYPFQKELLGIENKLKETPAEVILNELRSKSGPAYLLLIRRAQIIKSNNNNRFEIAKLSIAIAKLPKEKRELVANIARTGKVEQSIDLTGEGTNIANISRFINRCGINCTISENLLMASSDDPANSPSPSKEVPLTLGNKKIWLDGEKKKQMDENLDKIKKLNPLIQLKNAERHVRSFNDAEEKEYVSIQHQYLELLKAQDELVKTFEEEEKVSIEVS